MLPMARGGGGASSGSRWPAAYRLPKAAGTALRTIVKKFA
jgi:hypothetical protein